VIFLVINKIKKIVLVFFSVTLVSSLFTGCSKHSQMTSSEVPVSSSSEEDDCCAVQTSYANSSLITDIAWLQSNLKSSSLLILDARTEKEYSEGHIPGAINVNWQSFSDVTGKVGDKGFGVVLPAEELGKKLAAIGVDKSKNIIVYADNKSGSGEDGRFVWMLRMCGIANSKMLDGGYGSWQSKGLEISKESSPVKPSDCTLNSFDESYVVDTNWVKEHKSTVKLLDARDTLEYTVAASMGEVRMGHIPGAINLSFKSVFNSDGTIKSQSELDSMFSSLGLKKEDNIVTYCTAGVRSAHLAMILKLAGYNNVKNYNESFGTWAADSSLTVEK
jgi:thiosulfate/3-mercaptopyruvate sulfurtransferase